jgi:hypothetical protein
VRPAAAATIAAVVVLSLAPAVSAAATTGATQWQALGHGRTVTVLGKKGDGRTSIVAPVDRTGRQLAAGNRYAAGSSGSTAAARTVPHAVSPTPLSTWNVSYDANFNAGTPTAIAAKAAFQRAVDTWAHTVASPVTITVDAAFTAPPDPNVLGSAGPNNAFFNPDFGAFFPSALANSLQVPPTDLEPGVADIDAHFNNDANIWYFGTDPAGVATASCQLPGDPGPIAGHCYDFESVVLHELGHGLGFLGTASQDFSDANHTIALNTASYGNAPADARPWIYDIYTETADGVGILDYPNHSLALLNAIRSDGVYWFGANGASADRGREPQLYAPNPFEDGSTYSHLDEDSYATGDADSLMTPYVFNGDAVRDPGEVMLGMFRDMGWTTPGLPGSKYTALASPVRVLDTRGSSTPRVANGQSRTLVLTGHYGVPSNATAVILNVTGVSPLLADNIRAFPSSRSPGAPIPEVSNVNNNKGATRANLVTVPISAGGRDTRAGRVDLYVSGGATMLLADLQGYYAPTAATYFHPIAPVRVLNTTGSTAGPVVAGHPIDLKVTGAHGVPANAAAVAMTVTAVRATANTYVSVYPTGATPSSSSLNEDKGTTVANQVVAGVGTGGKVQFKNGVGSTHLIADLVGWYDTNSVGGTLFRPTLPTRLVDTRPGKLGKGGVRDVEVASADSFFGVPATATAAVVNLTGTAPTLPTYLTIYPKPASGAAFPNTSNVNLAAGQTAASHATVLLGSGGWVRVRNFNGQVAVIVDLAGWFGPA